MRVIAGQYKGLQIPMPKGGEIRPTTDRSKESLFNILQHLIDWPECKALDLFCGTGNISIELASRGCQTVVGVEKNARVAKGVKAFLEKRNIAEIQLINQDVFSFLKTHKTAYDLIFADPPYHHLELMHLPEIILSNQLLNEGGTLIIEHPAQLSWQHAAWKSSRKYGQSMFSFFSI